jgi:carbamoyl-phosphate synthase large subunit
MVMDGDVFLNERGAFILEFNPRFSGGYAFTHYAGGDLTKALIYWLKGESRKADECLNLRIGSKSLKGITMINAKAGGQIASSIYGHTVLNTIL